MFFTANVRSNLLPSSVLDSRISLFEKLYGQSPDYTSLRVFGCACYPTLRDYAHNKFDMRSLQCVFLGYNEKFKGYKCFLHPTGRVYISQHVIFDENVYPFSKLHFVLSSTTSIPLLSAWQQSFIQTHQNLHQ